MTRAPDRTADPPPGLEVTLDPENWNEVRALGRRMVDDAMTYLQTLRDRPVWTPVPDEVKEAFRQPVPRRGAGAETVYREFVDRVLPYPLGNIHPRFWGWVNGNGTPLTVLAELLAATMNPNAYGSDAAQYYVEHQVLAWFKELLGFPAQASGILLSGASAANLVGLAAALTAKAEVDVVEEGVRGTPRPMVVYASTEAHHSIEKAVRLLGLGRRSLRQIPAGPDFTIQLPELRSAIAEDRLAGRLPFCVVGTAGTIRTGAMDPLASLADVCVEEGLWLHVDGAFGALAAASPMLAPLTDGLARADSLGFDLHKWMFMPVEVGCALVRDRAAHRRAFAADAEYLERTRRGIISIDEPFGDYGLELTRGFRALKVWMGLKEQGTDRYVRIIEQNVLQARALEQLVAQAADAELLAPVSLNIVCFRYAPPAAPPSSLDGLNEEILLRLQEDGIAVFSSATLGGRFGLRAAFTNHRTRLEDVELAFESVRRVGTEVLAGEPAP